MKRITILGILALLVCLGSCKKSKPEEVSYEVTLLGATTWHGTYINESGQVVGITGAPSDWKYIFTNSHDLVAVSITVYPDGTDPLASASKKILVNGKQVALGVYGSSPQLQYQFP